MEAYTVDEVMDLLDGSEIDAENESEIEDPDIPLPSIESDDDNPVSSCLTDTQHNKQHSKV